MFLKGIFSLFFFFENKIALCKNTLKCLHLYLASMIPKMRTTFWHSTCTSSQDSGAVHHGHSGLDLIKAIDSCLLPILSGTEPFKLLV